MIGEKKKRGKKIKNRWKIFNESRIGKYICSSEVFTQWIKISYYRNARVYTHTHINVYTYVYIYIYTGSWNNMVYLQWNDSHLINCFAMLQWNSKSGKLSIFVTNSYCSPPLPFRVSLDSPDVSKYRHRSIFPRISLSRVPLIYPRSKQNSTRRLNRLKQEEGRNVSYSPAWTDRSIDSSLHTSLSSPSSRNQTTSSVVVVVVVVENKEEEGR